MSKIRSIILSLTLVIAATDSLWAARQVRARPILKSDKEYNVILLHVAEHFVLNIPDDHTIDEIRYNISCSFVIGDDGSIRQLEIENDVDSWVKTFEGKPKVDMWLRESVLRGMAAVPRFNSSQLKNIKSKKKRSVLFTFREDAAGSSTNIPHMGFNEAQTNINMEQEIAAQRERFKRAGTDQELPEDKDEPIQPDAKQLHFNQNPKWHAYAEENMTETMKEHMRPTIQTTHPTIIDSPEDKQPQKPKSEVVISLQ